MRWHLYIAGATLMAALLLATATSTGLNVCVQYSGKATFGLSCACDECDRHAESRDDVDGINCCQRCEDGVVLHNRCCTCTKLPALANALTVGKDLRPKVYGAPAQGFAVRLLAEAQPQIQWVRLAERPEPPPPLQSPILRL